MGKEDLCAQEPTQLSHTAAEIIHSKLSLFHVDCSHFTNMSYCFYVFECIHFYVGDIHHA